MDKDPGREKMIEVVAVTMGQHWPVMDLPLAEKMVDALIEEDGGRDHIVVVNDGTWTMRHPLTERFAGDLFTCPYNETVQRLAAQGAFDEGVHRLYEGEFGIIEWGEVPSA